MASGILFSPVSFSGKHANCRDFRLPARNSLVLLKGQKFLVKSSLDKDVSDMSVNAPKGLFPPEPERYRGPKLKVAIIGAGLAGMSTAVELLDQGHEVQFIT
ncbi:zeta-carotene desaturase [Cucumis melo var. makuwa]|uniref:Zeta-carotene desaturase n=1 Tax=Cucumis melo var. makuwa TaxID=1194695 RepID=A0A5A7V2Z1_CUCMM|nr:zeta-carotene desaturase [Cucumis melo var. makuwa]